MCVDFVGESGVGESCIHVGLVMYAFIIPTHLSPQVEGNPPTDL